MFSRIHSATTLGVDAYVVEVEVDISSSQLPRTDIVGLPDTAVKESRDRVRSAMKNSDLDYPNDRVTVNLAPADVRKEGPSFDLPIALAAHTAADGIPCGSHDGLVFVGELALDGMLRPVSGVLPIALMIRDRSDLRGIVLPRENAPEAALVDGIEIYPVDSLQEVVMFIEGRRQIERHPNIGFETLDVAPDIDMCFSEVKGQEHAKRVLEIAAAGNHNVMMIGPPGGGKTMLARRLPGIMPRLSRDEALEATKLYSVAGKLRAGEAMVRSRPFRSPHHTISNVMRQNDTAGVLGKINHETSLGKLTK